MKKIVYKIEGDTDPKDVLCTTYQMRNFFTQMADGFFSPLDVMNYIQHFKAVTMMKKNWRVLDVCCGRGLLLPLIRYYARDIKEYIGVDISERNISEQKRRSGTKKIEGLDYYPFKITHIIENVAYMASKIEGLVDFVIYTSAIEHMQREDGAASLRQCYKVMRNGAQLFISCPNTYEKHDPYDTQYAAHLYEWSLKELKDELINIGFQICDVFGLYAKKKNFDKNMKLKGDKTYERFSKYLPTHFLMAFYPILYPEYADEILIIAEKTNENYLF